MPKVSIPKNGAEFWEMVRNNLWAKITMTLLGVAMLGLYSYARDIRDAVVQEARDSAVAELNPRMDTLQNQMDTVKADVRDVGQKVDAMIEVMGEAFPEFKEAAQKHAEKQRARRDLRNALTGGGR